ncbi:hypothetical protein [Kitasatospora sp. NPDC001683]
MAFGTLTDVIGRGGFWLCETHLVALAFDGQVLVPAVAAGWYARHQTCAAGHFVRRRAHPRRHAAARIAAMPSARVQTVARAMVAAPAGRRAHVPMLMTCVPRFVDFFGMALW